MGFSAYFLVVWDLVRYAKSHNIRDSDRGGGARGIVRRVLPAHRRHRSHQVRPSFERFLNPGRKEMPDIDMDFDSRYRGEMIRYARSGTAPTGGAEVTFSTIKARAAVRDAARVSGIRTGSRQDREV